MRGLGFYPHAPLVLALAAAIVLSACGGVGPKYSRPKVAVPTVYRGSGSQEAPSAGTPSLGDRKWSEVFQDEQLQRLIQTALQQNYDVRIAATRILQAEAQLGITRSDQFPTVVARADFVSQRSPESQFPAFSFSSGGLSLSAAWELDFWGKFRRATEAARADLLTSEWARQAVVSTLVAELAGSYFRLRELDLELEISQRTVRSRQESLRLTQDLEARGLSSMLDVRQAEQLVFTAGAAIPDIERQIEQQENLISVLLGSTPAPVQRGRTLTDQPRPPEVPAGLPSSLLERRPDIQQAEQQLVAFNARIGVAKAAYFPQLSLTGLGGFRSSALTSLVSGSAGLWSFVAGLAQPIFTGGRIRSGVRFAEAQQQEALLVYEQTIQQAFRDVSDALVAYRKNQEFREQQELLTRSAQDAAQLSRTRYQSGVTSYLEVLTNETNYFEADLNLARARADELLAVVDLYRALGGGWQQ
ncbi:MAG: efflux transporter outer membrane subunit [Acidobacteria bacterium]|nr:MAG: efflux transporter outer membrane subunit [Acidobacteriota bacterium]